MVNAILLFYGILDELRACPICHGHSYCDHLTGNCQCKEGYTGLRCQFSINARKQGILLIYVARLWPFMSNFKDKTIALGSFLYYGLSRLFRPKLIVGLKRKVLRAELCSDTITSSICKTGIFFLSFLTVMVAVPATLK